MYTLEDYKETENKIWEAERCGNTLDEFEKVKIIILEINNGLKSLGSEYRIETPMPFDLVENTWDGLKKGFEVLKKKLEENNQFNKGGYNMEIKTIIKVDTSESTQSIKELTELLEKLNNQIDVLKEKGVTINVSVNKV